MVSAGEPIYCAGCNGAGSIGPVHLNYGNGRGEWRDNVTCFDCDGTGRWSEERLAAYRHGQTMRAERVSRGETILAAAHREGVSPSEISRRERGLAPYITGESA